MQIEMERITQGKTAFVTLPRSPEPGNPQHTTFHHPSETVAAGGFEGGAISQKPVLSTRIPFAQPILGWASSILSPDAAVWTWLRRRVVPLTIHDPGKVDL